MYKIDLRKKQFPFRLAEFPLFFFLSVQYVHVMYAYICIFPFEILLPGTRPASARYRYLFDLPCRMVYGMVNHSFFSFRLSLCMYSYDLLDLFLVNTRAWYMYYIHTCVHVYLQPFRSKCKMPPEYFQGHWGDRNTANFDEQRQLG